jgi:DNA mismatch endonuclease (patch repair protein)
VKGPAATSDPAKRRARTKKAGHRSWAGAGKCVPGIHHGDIMSPETRSRVMSRIRSKNTNPEKILARLLRGKVIRFRRHARDLPGRPDFVFSKERLVVFVDGDFWHGWRFSLWRHKLAPEWAAKIAGNRMRDARNFRRLRREGWKVLRLWEHQLEQSPTRCLERVLDALAASRRSGVLVR